MVFLSKEGVTSCVPSSSSSSFVIPRWRYDVFLSFRGEDTRKNFTDHLYTALNQKGINTFRDDEKLERGKHISVEISKAIEESKLAIIVFSKNYASSTWCLNELAKIVECRKERGMRVWPIFYHVDPSTVRKQKGNFAEAFAEHEERFKENMEKVQTWRAALREVTSLSGWRLEDSYESELIGKIVGKVFQVLGDAFPSITKGLVGIDSWVKEFNLRLCVGLDDVRFIGIWGMGGSGKTTLAKVVWDRFSDHFEACSFIKNVMDVYKENGLITLQQQLLFDILMEENKRTIYHIDRGVHEIMKALRGKETLLILDDVNHLDQLNYLAKECDWFGSGSRIIITTRDQHLLLAHGVEKNNIYECKGLHDEDALKLFCLKAFKKEQPKKGYVALSKEIVCYAGGLPLALVVLGTFLAGRGINQWRDALNRLNEYPEVDILKKLEISYDGLNNETEKKIFMYIACFLKGRNQGLVTNILDSLGLYPTIGMNVLIERSLITISNDFVWVHHLLQDMGWEILRKQSPTEPGNRMGLKLRKNIFDVLTNNKGTNAIEIINQESSMGEMENCTCSPEAFSKMRNLRFLKIRDIHFPQGLEYLSNELQILNWYKYSLKSLPPSFQPNKIRELVMRSSQIEKLQENAMHFPNLERIDLSLSNNLMKTPDLTGTPRLRILNLSFCLNLLEVHRSILVHKRLEFVDLTCCRQLEGLPGTNIDMDSLKTLILSGCLKVKRIPEFGKNMKRLQELCLNGTDIDKLPSSIEYLTSLALLGLRNCKNLMHIPSLPSTNIDMESPKTLIFSGCSKLKTIPKFVGNMKCIQKLYLDGTGITQLPSSIGRLTGLALLDVSDCKNLVSRISPIPMNLLQPLVDLCSLTELNLCHCNLLEGAIPNDIGSLSSLTKLYLGWNNFVALPASISQLSKLQLLDLNCCKRLQSLPELPSNIAYVRANHCASLETLSDISKLGTLGNPYRLMLYCVNCPKLVKSESDNSVAITELQRYLQGPNYDPNVPFRIISPGSKISSWFNYQREGKEITLELPPNWCDSTWTGFALCTRFFIKPKSSISCESANNLDAYLLAQLYEGDEILTHFINCIYFNEVFDRNDLENHGAGYLPRNDNGFGNVDWNKCSRINFCINASSVGMDVTECSARLIYKKDVEELKPGADSEICNWGGQDMKLV